MRKAKAEKVKLEGIRKAKVEEEKEKQRKILDEKEEKARQKIAEEIERQRKIQDENKVEEKRKVEGRDRAKAKAEVDEKARAEAEENAKAESKAEVKKEDETIAKLKVKEEIWQKNENEQESEIKKIVRICRGNSENELDFTKEEVAEVQLKLAGLEYGKIQLNLYESGLLSWSSEGGNNCINNESRKEKNCEKTGGRHFGLVGSGQYGNDSGDENDDPEDHAPFCFSRCPESSAGLSGGVQTRAGHASVREREWGIWSKREDGSKDADDRLAEDLGRMNNENFSQEKDFSDEEKENNKNIEGVYDYKIRKEVDWKKEEANEGIEKVSKVNVMDDKE